VGELAGPPGHGQTLQQAHRPTPGVAAGHAHQQRRQLHVLDRRQLVDQVERLEDEADAAAAEDRPGGLGEPVHAPAAEAELAGVGAFEPAEQVQQGRLPAAARPHDRHRLARLHHQVHAVHGPDG
jgi:hypothetical protein